MQKPNPILQSILDNLEEKLDKLHEERFNIENLKGSNPLSYYIGYIDAIKKIKQIIEEILIDNYK